MGGTVLGQVFSADTEDEVYSTLFYPRGVTAQLSVNWSDESYRKMTTKVTLWGTKGRIVVEFGSVDDLQRIIGVMAPEITGRRPDA